MNTEDAGIQSEHPILVIDVPLTATAEEFTRLLDGPCARGYYVSTAIAWPGLGARVILRRYAKPATNETDKPAGREARAMQFIRDNREMSGKELSAALKALGFPRGVGWVCEKRADIIRAERRIT